MLTHTVHATRYSPLLQGKYLEAIRQDTVRVNKEYKKSHCNFFPPCLSQDVCSEIWCAIYAGATEDTSVLDVETSEPSSTFFPKSCMMHTRNCKERQIKIILGSFLNVHKVWALLNRIDLPVGSWRHKWWDCRWWRSLQSRQAWLLPVVEGIAWVRCSKAGKDCVRSPANTVGHDHDNHHSGHFLLCFLCGLRILSAAGATVGKKW